MSETIEVIVIPVGTAHSLLNQLGQTAKYDEYVNLSLLIGLAMEANENTIRLMGSLIDCFNFYNEVGML